jgi:hypothetical protein
MVKPLKMRSRPGGSIKRKLLIVHGVGDFNEDKVTREVQNLAERYTVCEVSAFNWDIEVGGPFKGFSMDLGILAELCAGLLTLANLGFVQMDKAYCGISQRYLRFENCVYAVGQIALAFSIPLIALSFVASWAKLALLYIVALLFVVSIVGWIASRSVAAFLVAFRRLTVTLLWPVIHFFAVPVGFGLIALTLLFLSLLIQGAINSRFEDLGVLGTLGHLAITIVARLAVFGLLIIISGLIMFVVHPVMKVLSDIARYIGLAGRRTILIELLAKKITTVASDCDHLIILAHSLGSVIAVDCMQEHPEIFKSVGQVDFVTMGSPLRRLFQRFFPEIYLPVVDIEHLLRSRIGNFAWINVYRPFDVIGAGLSKPGSKIIEVSTRQWLRNHTNYWADPVVAKLLIEGINRAQHSPAPGTQDASSNWREDLCAETYNGRLFDLWSRRMQFFNAVFLIGAIWIVIWLAKSILQDPLFWPGLSLLKIMAKDGGWPSLIAQLAFMWVMTVAGFIAVVRFIYQKVWYEWIRAYGDTLLGFINEARSNPLMRYAPQKSAHNTGIRWNRVVVKTALAFCILALFFAYFWWSKSK